MIIIKYLLATVKKRFVGKNEGVAKKGGFFLSGIDNLSKVILAPHAKCILRGLGFWYFESFSKLVNSQINMIDEIITCKIYYLSLQSQKINYKSLN